MKRFSIWVLIALAMVLQVSLVSAGGLTIDVDLVSDCRSAVVDYNYLIQSNSIEEEFVDKSFGSDLYYGRSSRLYFTEVDLVVDGQLIDTFTSTQRTTPSDGWSGQATFTFAEREGTITVTANVRIYTLVLENAQHSLPAQYASKSIIETHEVRVADEISGSSGTLILNGVIDPETITVDCATAQNPIPSLCPDGRLNTNLCEPIAIYAARDDDGSFTIAVYQSAPAALVGTYLFDFTSEELAAAAGSDTNVVLGTSGFATAYLTPDGQIVFEAGPDFEGKIFYFTFDVGSFPDALPTITTNY